VIAARLALLAALLAPAMAAANPHLQRARSAMNDLDYEMARAALDDALTAGISDPTELAEIYELSGTVAGAFELREEAADWFRKWLALDPTARLDSGLAPKIVEPFQTARASTELALRVRSGAHVAGETEIVLLVEADPVGLVAGARLDYRDEDGGVHVARAAGTDRIVIALPWPPPVGAAVLAATDVHGNRLAELEWTAPAESNGDAAAETETSAEPEALAVLPATAEPDTPLYAKWSLWGGAAVGLGLAGAYFAFEASSDQRELDEIIDGSAGYTYAEAKRVENRGNRHALLANTSFGAALACGAVSAVLLIRSATRKEKRAPRHQLAPMPLTDGAGVAFALEF
jgi:tetratricopeptide (TPR) repeat protein